MTNTNTTKGELLEAIAVLAESKVISQSEEERLQDKVEAVTGEGNAPRVAYIEAVKASSEYKTAEALKAAREWMALNAPGTDWANRVRQQLNEAIGQEVA